MTGSHYRLGAPSVSLLWGPPVTFNSILPSFSVSSVSFPIALLSPQGTSLDHKCYAWLSLQSLLGPLHCGFSVPGLLSILPRVPRAALGSPLICSGWSQDYQKKQSSELWFYE